MPLAGRTFLQMDQTAPANQEVFRDLRKRYQDPNLDCRFRLCARRHPQKTSPTADKSLHNSTDFERDDFRENPHFTSVFDQRIQNQRGYALQPIEFVRLTTGH